MIHHLIDGLSPAPFSVEEVSKVDSDLSAANIIVRIAAGIKTDQFKPLMKIESDCICILDSRKHDDVIVEKNAVNAENSLF